MLTQREDTEAAVEVLHFGQRISSSWPIFLLGWGTAFQFVVAAVLAAAPYHQVLTPGTRPVLEIASRYVWAALFLATGALTVATLYLRPWLRALAWIVTMGLGGVWLTAFSVNVLTGGGSALGVVAWFFLYVPLAAVALNTSLITKR